MSLTPLDQFRLNYLQNIYPRGLRNSSSDENSLVYKYDVVRTNTLTTHINQTQAGVNNLFVLTSDENGVTERETFLHLPINPALSLAARKARLIVRLSGNPATIQNLRTVIQAFI